MHYFYALDGETDYRFWDCECTTNYIHDKIDTQGCLECGTVSEVQPDSMTSELLAQGFVMENGKGY